MVLALLDKILEYHEERSIHIIVIQFFFQKIFFIFHTMCTILVEFTTSLKIIYV